MKQKLAILAVVVAVAALGCWTALAFYNPHITYLDLSIDGVADNLEYFEPDPGTPSPTPMTPSPQKGPGAFVVSNGWKKITLAATGINSPMKTRLNLCSDKIEIWTATNAGTQVICPKDYDDDPLTPAPAMPTELWVKGVKVSATGPAKDASGNWTSCGPEHTTLEAINNGDLPTTPGTYYDHVAFTVINLDLDVDSDNDNGFAAPDRSTVEDDIEDDATKLGKCLGVNTDDSDGDGVPDFADGFDWDGVAGNADDISTEDEFVQLVLEVSSSVDLTSASMRLTYSASDPSGVSTSCAPTVWSPASGHLRIWKKNADQSRDKASCAATSPGDYVPPQVYSDLSKLGLSGSTRTVTLYVEGITNSSTIGDQQIMVELDPDGSGAVAGWTALDAVRMTVVKVDVTAVWPEPNGGAGYEVHDAIEEDSFCWQMLVNDDDDNLDDVPDMDRTCQALDSGDSNIATVRLAIKPLPDLGQLTLELDDAAAVRLYTASGATRLHDPSASGGSSLPFSLDLAGPASSSPLAPILAGVVEFRIEGIAVNTNLSYSLKYTIGTAVVATDIARQSIGKESMLGDLGYGEVSSSGSEEQNSDNTSESVGIASVSPSAASSVSSIGSGTILRIIPKCGGRRFVPIPPDPYDFKIYFVKSPDQWTTRKDGKLRNASIELKHLGSPAASMSLRRVTDGTDGTVNELPALRTYYNTLLVQQNAQWMNEAPLLANEAALRAMLLTIGISADDIRNGMYWYTPAKVDDSWIQKAGTEFKYKAKIDVPAGSSTIDLESADQETEIFRLDADVDSNNNGTVDADNTKEDRYEYDNGTSPGQVVEVNCEAVIDIRENELPVKGKLVYCVLGSSSASGIKLYKGTDTTPLECTPGTQYSIPYGPSSGGAACPAQFRVKAGGKGTVHVGFGYQSLITGAYLWDVEPVSVYYRDPISRSPYSKKAKAWCPYAWTAMSGTEGDRRIANTTVPALMGPAELGVKKWLEAEGYDNSGVYKATSPDDDDECTAANFIALCKAGVLVIQTHGNSRKFVVKAFRSEAQRTQWASTCPALQPTEAGVLWETDDGRFPCISVSTAWLAAHWKPTLDANQAIVVVNSCHSALPWVPGAESIIESIGGRVRFGWNGKADASIHMPATHQLFERLVGAANGGTKRTVQDAYNLCQPEYADFTSANPVSTGKWKHSWDSADAVWTTVCPAPTKTFPASIQGYYDMPIQWGCLISDTYLDTAVGAANDSVTQYSGTSDVMQQRAWLPSPTIDATKVYMIGFEYEGHMGPFKARAVRAKCVNYVTAAGERRSMDMDRVRPNDDKDLIWPPPSLVP